MKSIMPQNLNQEDLKILKELESLAKMEFSIVEKIKGNTKMGFTIENGRVTGCGLYRLYLKELPDSLVNLESLKELYMDVNDLKYFPEPIGKLKSLQVFHANRNKLKELPDSIGDLKSLKEFWIYENSLTSLPESIGELESLEELYLSDNKIK